MTLCNSYQIVKVLNSLCVSTPLRKIELPMTQNSKKRMNHAKKWFKINLRYEIVSVADRHKIYSTKRVDAF